jgi:hypothetical protein
MKYANWNRRWIPAIAFWMLFLGSFALGPRYPQLDSVWVGARLLLLLILLGYGIMQLFRTSHDKATYIGYRGMLIPRWLVTIFGGEVEEVRRKDADPTTK